MLTSVYNGAFTRGLRGAVQEPGFEGCFVREQDGNGANFGPVDKSTVIGL